MTTLNPERITSLPEAIDVDKTISVITLAFAADPICRFWYPDPETYYKYFPPFVRAFAGAAFEAGTAYVAEDCRGAALWFPPGIHADEDELNAVLEEGVPPALLIERVIPTLEKQNEAHPKEPHWYLPLIGVDPAHQHMGVGGRLLERSLEAADRDVLPAYLEATSPGSRDLYRRHGFEVVGQIRVPGSPPMWPMWREPRSR
jgi:GNAT superfamily N-acetyltransferase